jgi:aminocarboxymuconate-semialdehyde decarboxylase
LKTDLHAHIIPEALLKSEFLQADVEEVSPGVRGFVIWGNRIRPAYLGSTDFEAHLADMEKSGVEREMLSVPPYLFGYHKEPGFCREWSRACNEALAAIRDKHPQRFGAMCTVPMQDVAAACAELKHCVENLGFAGVEVCSHVNEEDLDTPQCEECFARADRLKCGVLIHPHNIPAPKRLAAYYTANLVGNPTETALTAARMLLSGFFGKYPNVKVCYSHGGGAFPFILSRIRHGFSVRLEPKSGGLDAVEIPKNMFFDSIIHDEAAFRFMVQAVGVDHVALGTDYPFDMQLSEPVRKITAWCGEENAKRILEDNPARFCAK